MPKAINIQPGDMFGRWRVIEAGVNNPNKKYPNRSHLCECTCGSGVRKYLLTTQLVQGISRSCGCLQKEMLAERNANNSSVQVGNKYGKLTVIQDLGMRKQNSRNQNERWSLCQCECGSEPIEVKNNMLQNGWKKSCGCLHSQGEYTIMSIFKKANLLFQTEYKFNDLIGTHNGILRFDFAVFNNNQELLYLIEFDGRQHFTGPESGWKNGQSFETILAHDQLKNEYCKTHNIIRKRIPFYEIRNLTLERIESSEFNV